MLYSVEVNIELPYRRIKHEFGFVKVFYRGLEKNAGQVVRLFALDNLWQLRK